MISYFFLPLVLGSRIVVKEGDNLSLPCAVEKTEWRHNNNSKVILYVPGTGGEILKSSNVTLEVSENGTHLMIQNVKLMMMIGVVLFYCIDKFC